MQFASNTLPCAAWSTMHSSLVFLFRLQMSSPMAVDVTVPSFSCSANVSMQTLDRLGEYQSALETLP